MSNIIHRNSSIPSLTGVRFFAALMVFFSHYPIVGSSTSFRSFQDAGYSGVTFFFILSGFIITYNYLEKFEEPANNPIKSFYFARFARIYPIYVICVLYAWATSTDTFPLWPHLLAVQAWSADVNMAMAYNGPGWSISVEAFLYLLFPIIIHATNAAGITRSRKRLLAFFAAIASFQILLAVYFFCTGKNDLSVFDPASAHRWLYRAPAPRLLDFCLGISAAIYFKRFMQRSAASEIFWKYATYSALTVIVFLMFWKVNLRSTFSWDAAYALPFTILVIGLAEAKTSIVSRFLSTRTLILLGEASFAFYLIHTLARKIYIYDLDASFIYNLSLELGFLAVVILISIGMHMWIEKPSQRALKRFFETGSIVSKPDIKRSTSN